MRSCEDVDEAALSYAEIKALCAGNPKIKEKMDLDIEVVRLRLLKADHQSQHYRLEDNLLTHFPQGIEQAKEQIEGFKDDQARIEAGTQPNKDGFSPMVIAGATYTDKGKAGAALVAACKKIVDDIPEKIGSYRGLDMMLSFDPRTKSFKMALKGAMSYRTDLGDDLFGNITRINNAVAELPQRLVSVQKQLENLYQQVQNAEQEIKKPFPFETALELKAGRLALLDAELNMDGSHKEQEQEQLSLESGDPENTVAAAKEPERISAKGKPSILADLREAVASVNAPADNGKQNELVI